MKTNDYNRARLMFLEDFFFTFLYWNTIFYIFFSPSLFRSVTIIYDDIKFRSYFTRNSQCGVYCTWQDIRLPCGRGRAMVWDAVAIGDECGPERRRVGWSGSGKEGGEAGRLNGKN